jgi:hypothetical protein
VCLAPRAGARRRRTRALAAIGLGALLAAVTWVVLAAVDEARNPCKRLAAHYCAGGSDTLKCETYTALREDSESEPSTEMRQNIRYQCQTHVERLEAGGTPVR